METCFFGGAGSKRLWSLAGGKPLGPPWRSCLVKLRVNLNSPSGKSEPCSCCRSFLLLFSLFFFFCSMTRCFIRPPSWEAGCLVNTCSNSGVKTECFPRLHMVKKKTLGNIFFSFYKQLCCCFFIKWVLQASHPFSLIFFLLHIQIIWAKVYYLLYNINSKIFAFLLLSTDVLYCTGYKGSASRMTMGPPDLWTGGIIMDKLWLSHLGQKKRWIFILFYFIL